MTLRALCAQRDYGLVVEALGLADYPEGQAPHHAGVATVLAEIKLLRKQADKLTEVQVLLEKHGCDCDCGCHIDGHGEDCDPCLACQVSEIVR